MLGRRSTSADCVGAPEGWRKGSTAGPAAPASAAAGFARTLLDRPSMFKPLLTANAALLLSF